MSKYFTYRSREEFIDDLQSAGAPIALSSDYSPLFAPIQIGNRSAKNRFAIHPMEGCDGTSDGRPAELTIRRYQRFAQGGCAIIWGEATAVREEGRMNTRQLWINNSNWEDFARMLEQSRRDHAENWGNGDGFLFGLQLTHSGRYCYGRPLIPQRDPGLDPATFLDPITKTKPIPADYPVLTDDYLKSLEDDFISAAELAYRAGFDFVDIKQCHRYLLSELLASHNREGEYGGSYENRTRFVKNVIGRIRDRLPHLMIASRINVFDGVPYVKDSDTGRGKPRQHSIPFRHGWGTDQENPLKPDLREPLKLVSELRDLGVSLLSVSMGSPYSSPHYLRPADTPPLDGYHAPEHPAIGSRRHFDATGEFQRAFPEMVVLGAGYSWLQWLMCDAAAANISAGNGQVAGFGRAAIAYPDFVRDLMNEGTMVKTKVCVTVSYCTALMRFKHNADLQYATGCAVRDKYYAELYKTGNRAYKALIAEKEASKS
jgi:2,4-dienoyl-CoA reductase-like NADH-dependent reductase (Old Yellow Enzyme family)